MIITTSLTKQFGQSCTGVCLFRVPLEAECMKYFEISGTNVIVAVLGKSLMNSQSSLKSTLAVRTDGECFID